MDGLIYDEEQLPEIEVEELLTLDEMVQHQPSFVAFSPSELHTLIQQLTDPRRADTFFRMHTRLLRKTTDENASVFENIVCSVDAKRVHFTEDGDESVYTEQLQRAKQAPNYTLQQTAFHKLSVPFQPAETSSDENAPELTEVQARILLEDGSQSVLLPLDPIRVRLLAAQWHKNARTSTDYVMDDDHVPSKLPPVVAWVRKTNTDDDNLSSWIKTYVRPKLSSVVDDIPEHASLHDIQRILARFGYVWNSLSQDQTDSLKEYATKIVGIMPDIDDKAHIHRQNRWKGNKKFHDFQDVLQSLEQLIHSRISEDAKQRLEDMYGAWLQSIPPLPPSIPLPDPSDIAHQLADGSVPMDEIVEQLRQWYQRWELDIASRFMDKVRNTGPETSLGKYAEKLDVASQVQASKHSIRTQPFLSIHSELADIKVGTDTFFYDGQNTTSGLGFVFEELGETQGYDGKSLETEDDDDATTDLPMIPEETYDALPPALETCNWSEGTKEVASFVWSVLQRVKRASGLPCPQEDAYVRLLISRVPRLSCHQSLKQYAPSLSNDLISALITSDVKTALSRLEDLVADEASKSNLAPHIPHIYKEWSVACNEATVLVLTAWWLDLMISSLQGTLDFSISNAMGRFLHLWSPFGAPVEDIRRVRTGILPYMCAVTESLYPHIGFESLQEQMMTKAESGFHEVVVKLQTMWQELQTSQRVLDKAKLAKMSLMDAIVAMKAKQKVNVVPAFVQALLYLPGVLPAKRQVSKAHRWVQGCCAAPLGQSFEADVDWKDAWRDLHMIKQGLSRKRWSQEPRRMLRMHSINTNNKRNTAASSVTHKSRACSNVTHSVSHDTMQTQDKMPSIQQETWIPKQHLDMLVSRPMDVEAWSKTVLSRLYGKNKMSGMIQASQALRTVSLMLSWISRVTTDVLVRANAFNDSIHKVIVPLRNMLRTLGNDGGTSHIFTYCFVRVCCLPSSVHGTVIEDPVGVTIQQLNASREMVYQISMEYVKNGVALSQDEIQRFITKKREQQKQISIAKMDILTTEDRQLLQDAKKLKLVKLVEAEELHDVPEDNAILDMEAENEFRMAPSDRDDMNVEMLD